jgi:hypothetical protein
MPRTKKFSEKRGARFSVSVSYDSDTKLELLAVSCNMSKSELMDLICTRFVNEPSCVKEIQDKYNRVDRHRVLPVWIDGRLTYQ